VTGGSGPKRRGSAFERDIVAFLQAHGFPYAERSFGAGRPEDVGDVDGLPGFVIEAKAHRSLDLAGWIDEAETERLNARQPFAVVVAKRRNKPTSAAYAVMTLESFARLVADEEAP
jgi:Holliday junction resolvase